MKRGAVVNLLIGLVIALLPLYNRITEHDFSRTCKDNLLLVIFGVLCFLLPYKQRKIPRLLWIAFIYCMINLVFNQWLVMSINVMFQTFYIGAGIVFFMSFYEKHDHKSISFISAGMVIGCLIQSLIGIGQFFNHDFYPYLYGFFNPGAMFVNHSAGGGIGSTLGTLGNTNLFASYVAMTSMSLLEKGKKKFLLLPIFAVCASGSVMGMASLFAGILYHYRKGIIGKWQLYTASIISMFTIYMAGDLFHLDSGRFKVWSRLFSIVSAKHFLFGMGPGWFADKHFIQGDLSNRILENFIVFAQDFQQFLQGASFQLQKPISGNEIILVLQEHNAFLSAFNVFGIILFIIFIPIFIKFITSEDKNKIFSSVVFVAFINSYGHFSLHQSTVAIIIIVSAAICLSEGDKKCLELGPAAPY